MQEGGGEEGEERVYSLYRSDAAYLHPKPSRDEGVCIDEAFEGFERQGQLMVEDQKVEQY